MIAFFEILPGDSYCEPPLRVQLAAELEPPLVEDGLSSRLLRKERLDIQKRYWKPSYFA